MPVNLPNIFCLRRGSCLAVLCFLATAANAVDSAGMNVESVVGAGWSAQGVQAAITFDASGPGLGATLQAQTVVLPGSLGVLKDVRVLCPQLELKGTQFYCAKSTLNASSFTLGAQKLAGSFTYDRATGGLGFALQGQGFTAQHVRIAADGSSRRWTLTLQMEGGDAKKLLPIAGTLSPSLVNSSATGLIDLRLHLTGSEDVHSVEGQVKLAGVTAGTADGSIATDKLDLDIKGSAQRMGGDWHFSIESNAARGQAYAEPLFLDFGPYPLHAMLAGTLHSNGDLQIDHFALAHSASFTGSGHALLSFAAAPMIRELDATIDTLQFPGAYSNYLQPFLLQTDFKALTTAGQASGRLRIVDGAVDAIDLQLRAVDFDDGGDRIALGGLSGEVHWRGSPQMNTLQEAVPSSVAWQNGSLLGLKLGASRLDFSTGGRAFRLNQPAHVPVLDGAVEIERLGARSIGTEQLAFSLDATVRPISVEGISKAFDWPGFGGTLSGRISGLEMHDGVMTLETTLSAAVFDGQVAIGGLRLEDAFGRFPRLHSDISIESVDLEQVTSAFSFGRITGRLSGNIRHLTLFNWMPVAFEATLATPAGDRSKHVISQRAVSNIGSLGGSGAGVTAALSSGFLKFFDDFNYDRLGISCRLENEVCAMDGVLPASSGYYLVKGKGLPRIDVIGSAQRVDWPRLVGQLKAIAESDGPVVK